MLVTFFSAALVFMSCGSAVESGGHWLEPQEAASQLVRVDVASLEALERLEKLAASTSGSELRTEGFDGESVELKVTPSAAAALAAEGFAVEVIIADLEEWYAQAFGGSDEDDFFDQYRSYEEHVEFLQDLADAYPELATLSSIGQSVEGRELWVLRISGGEGDKNGIVVNGAQQGDKIVTPAVVAYLAQSLLAGYDADPEIRRLVDATDWYLMPMLNPDGYERRSRYNAHGVDLNRNWGGPGHGENPFSEPETAALRDLLLAHPEVRAHADLFGSPRHISWPWAYTNERPHDEWTFDLVAYHIAREILESRASYYSRRDAAYLDGLRPGLAIDYTYGVLGLWSLAVNMGITSNPPVEEILPICREVSAGLRRFGSFAGDCNHNGTPDPVDIANGLSTDCNGNRTPDECESQGDCNGDRIPDICDADWRPENCPGYRDAIRVPEEAATILDGLFAVRDGGSVILSDGVYTGYGNKDFRFMAGKGVTIRSENGAERCTLDAEGFGSSPRYRLGEAAPAGMHGLTLRGASSAAAGLTVVQDCTFIDNRATYTLRSGSYRFDLLVENSRIMNNTGIGIEASSYATVDDCEISGNGGDGLRCGINCIIRDSRIAGNAGRGIRMSQSQLIRCVIEENQGGGVVLEDRAWVVDCIIRNNRGEYGAGVRFDGSSAFPAPQLMERCLLSGNVATMVGGAVAAGLNEYNEPALPGIFNCRIENNRADSGHGGGAYFYDCEPTIYNTAFVGNEAVYGGGVSAVLSPLRAAGCLWARNSASKWGGAVYLGGGIQHIAASTFADNRARRGPAISAPGCALYIVDSIFWDNEDEPTEFLGGRAWVKYSDVEGGWRGPGNISADPRFVDPEAGDYRLAEGSPCVDAGDSRAFPGLLIADLDGHLRRHDDPRTPDTGRGPGPKVDMGAYELAAPPMCRGTEVLTTECKPDDGGYRLTARIEEGQPNGWVTLRYDAYYPSSQAVKLTGNGSATVVFERSYGGDYEMELVECQFRVPGKCP